MRLPPERSNSSVEGAGKRVGLAEKHEVIGGDCNNTGTIFS